MKRTPKLFIAELSAAELHEAILEIDKWHSTGVLTGIRMRSIAEKLEKEFDIPSYVSLQCVERMILMRAALLWVEENCK